MTDALIELAHRIALETARPVPTPNPRGPLTAAGALFVLRDPGATPTSGANETGILDPLANRDRTATRTRRLLREAGIDPGVCLWWNAVPYHLGYSGGLRDDDRETGARCLRQVLECCRSLRVVVAMGEAARVVCDQVWSGSRSAELPTLIRTWHPMTRGRGGAERQAELRRDIQRTADLIRR